MDRHALLHPVGPLPERVYWIRRLLPLGVVLLLVVIIAIACSGGSGKAHPGSSGQGAATTPSPTPTGSSASAAAPGRCRHDQISVVASTDAASYPAGVQPVLRLTIRNIGTVRCVLIESPSTRTWTITSGSDRIWTTAGCTASHVAGRTVLAPGRTSVHALSWNRHRSGQNCTTSDTTANPGTYQLVVTSNGVTSAPAVFHLTG